MLILTRKPGESLYIGDSIKVTIVELKGHQVRVGIDAPNEMRIYREEIYIQILEENKRAAEAAMDSLEGLPVAWAESSSGGEAGGKSSGEEQGNKMEPALPKFRSLLTSRNMASRSVEPDVVKRKRVKKGND